eukprot:Amastigsp_a341524_24.p1 type:complete len:145 gc:universal Amastigsp_a341524_24:734-300(-)
MRPPVRQCGSVHRDRTGALGRQELRSGNCRHCRRHRACARSNKAVDGVAACGAALLLRRSFRSGAGLEGPRDGFQAPPSFTAQVLTRPLPLPPPIQDGAQPMTSRGVGVRPKTHAASVLTFPGPRRQQLRQESNVWQVQEGKER